MATAASGEEEEAAQEAALHSYKEQLNQVEMTLGLVETDEDKVPLLQLVDDLKELIQISEEGLLQLKKENLMKLINGECGGGLLATDSSPRVEDGAFNVGPSTSSASDDRKEAAAAPPPPPPRHAEELFAKYSPLLGTSCRAPFPPSRRSGVHNAIVHALEGIDDDGQLQVKVIYTHPQEPKMVTCPFFLDDRCHFDDDKCRQNHGVVVSASGLEDYVEPDYENGVSVGSLCLAKHDPDGGSRRSFPLWLPAEVLHIEEGLVTVQIKSVNQTIALPFEHIFPLGEEDDDDTDDDESDESAEEAADAGVVHREEEEDEDLVREIKVAADLTEFGLWEASTRGIASKLLAKWGYVKGAGLGKDGEGRVVPVEARIFPQGKSLDVCMAMRLKSEGLGSDDDLLRKKKRERRKRKKGEEAVQKGYTPRTKREESMSAFNFINSIKLTKKGGTMTVEGDEEGEERGSSKRQKQKSATSKEKSCKDLRVQLLQTEGEVAKVEKEIEKVEETIVRNEKKNSPVAAQAREKKKELENYKLKLKNSLKSIQGEQKNRNCRYSSLSRKKSKHYCFDFFRQPGEIMFSIFLWASCERGASIWARRRNL